MNASRREKGAAVFGYHTNEPEQYGVVEFDAAGNAISLEEGIPARSQRLLHLDFIIRPVVWVHLSLDRFSGSHSGMGAGEFG